LLCVLLSVAYLTLLERKLLAAYQRRVGPDSVGLFGILQAIADAVKLITKQNSTSSNTSLLIFYVSPIWSLCLIIASWSVVIMLFLSNYNNPSDYLGKYDNLLHSYSWLLLLAILSLTIYSVLLLGWAANNAYAFLGSLRSSSALISYELVLSTAALFPMILSTSYDLYDIIFSQVTVLYLIPLLPVAILFFISTLAESSRVPFDLVEAESELVSGYMTENASVLFTLLFLSEYASIMLFAVINSILWFGTSNYYSLSLSTIFMLTLVILARALLPRLRYDQLITLCWLYLLPITFVLAVLVPSLYVTLLL
jgi:NADH-ubiquinone oxidoreductase chain 1